MFCSRVYCAIALFVQFTRSLSAMDMWTVSPIPHMLSVGPSLAPVHDDTHTTHLYSLDMVCAYYWAMFYTITGTPPLSGPVGTTCAANKLEKRDERRVHACMLRTHSTSYLCCMYMHYAHAYLYMHCRLSQKALCLISSICLPKRSSRVPQVLLALEDPDEDLQVSTKCTPYIQLVVYAVLV